MGKPQYIQIIVRVLLILINGIIVYYSFTNSFIINTIGFFLLVIFQLFLLIDYLKKLFNDIEKSIDCLLYDDYSNTISKEKRKNPLHNKTALLLEKHRKQSLQKTSEQLIFTNIIESLSIGILILRKDTEGKIEVFQINKAFTEFLKIPKFYNWNLLNKKIGSLTDYINQWKENKLTISLTINEEKEEFFLKTSLTQTNEYGYLIVSLETIQQLIDKKEKEAWFKLMNVMSHEIINTITPISSLAENLDSLLQEENTDEDTIDELSQGLKIIKRRSHHLTSFVDTYRKLAELPLPQKEEINLTTIVKNTLLLFEQEFHQKNIKIDFKINDSYVINADKQQIEQVIINLISNCLYAFEGIEKPVININIYSDKNRTHLTILDNGIGISDEIKDNIFIPYFTTRKDGSGIGLTLSKSIMEAHNGNIQFNSTKEKTTFSLTFIS
ncbi:sensor histidine kinase [Polaribacter sp. Hel1_85]|uniref:sensor histidine kinase n=1 Tax=Polaribacter sp. Hel1_85 TaxID=1250005 RepID=UPI00052B6A0C|nr:HAMP domain-containing sensor histidine kinase [Polaribacter sp. Hel1_85]KGL64059.1 two-component sensor signal transduction histidine kinase [Polaribacter sp. Hel1_85]